MEDYNFWQDLFDTYQSLSDWMKLAWLVVPPAFLLGLIALILRFRLTSKERSDATDGELIYSVRSDEENEFRIYGHRHEQIVKDAIVLLPTLQRERRLTFKND